MNKIILILLIALLDKSAMAQQEFITGFEKSGGTETATYEEGIAFYKSLNNAYSEINMEMYGESDIGRPLHLVTLSLERDFDYESVRSKDKRIYLINNAIHPGEPDGVDASMMFLRDLVQNIDKYRTALEKIVIVIIPFYNIGGVLNRNDFSRVNQNGPKEHGFRGNARNYDLNRDFIKNDTKNARSFAAIFQKLDPDIFVDTHVSNGADYPYVMTMDIAQKDKLGGVLADYLEETMMPSLFEYMKNSGYEMIPYVNIFNKSPDEGYSQFFDSPRYSAGYTALFHTIGFQSEPHMLKPYKARVYSTYAFLQGVLEVVSRDSGLIRKLRDETKATVKTQKLFDISWKLDDSRYTELEFKGYEATYIESEVTGQKRLFYDRSNPYRKTIPYYNHYVADVTVERPDYYIIPRGWHTIIDLLKLNQVEFYQTERDSIIAVEVYYIEDYKTRTVPFEGHYMHYDVNVRKETQKLKFSKGDYVVPVNQWRNRYIVETLEPQGMDSFFSWNLFDTILQRKEGYSPYVFEEMAAQLLKDDLILRAKFEERKQRDHVFAKSSKAQLDFIYVNSPYYEKEHLRYPVFRSKTNMKPPGSNE
jgi:hypothetical protein